MGTVKIWWRLAGSHHRAMHKHSNRVIEYMEKVKDVALTLSLSPFVPKLDLCEHATLLFARCMIRALTSKFTVSFPAHELGAISLIISFSSLPEFFAAQPALVIFWKILCVVVVL